MIVKITPQPYESYTQQVVLDNVAYLIGLTWNSRAGQWILDVMQPNETPIIMGIPLVFGINLFWAYPDLGLPNNGGTMQAVDLLGTGDQIGHDDLTNGRVFLAWVDGN